MAGTPRCTNHDDRPGVFMWSTWDPAQTAVWCAECMVPGLIEMVAAQTGGNPEELVTLVLGGTPAGGAVEHTTWETYEEAVTNGKVLLATGEINPEQYEAVIRPLFQGLSEEDQDRAIEALEHEADEDEIAAQLASETDQDKTPETEQAPGTEETSEPTDQTASAAADAS